MKLTKIIIKNYRCFGPNPTTIEFDNLTGFIGHNSSGKTAALTALIKLFGEKSSERIIEKSDFHIPEDSSPDNIDNHNLYIETQFEFPELENNNNTSVSVPIYFNNMLVKAPGKKLYIRIRLEASWEKSSNPEGSIDSNIYYITSDSEDINTDNKRNIKRYDLDQIKVIYVPAIRKPNEQLRNVSGTIISRLLNGINWSDITKKEIEKIATDTENIFSKEQGVKILQEALINKWGEYHKDFRYSVPKINFNSSDLATLLKKVDITFSPTKIYRNYRIEELGDGLRSLFYLSLVNTFLEIEEHILLSDNDTKQNSFSLIPPALTIVAIEEPENHISPHLLGRVIENLNNISKKENTQVIITSHSPSIIKRIEPTNIRFFRVNKESSCTSINSISLPDSEKETMQFKFIKEAVLSHPELYFSKLIVLGEGESEEIIIKKMIELKGVSIDSSEISIVPLGGKHVNHFWRLLNNLQIPYITLLDLDRERNGGGWGRIQYVRKQLIKYIRDENSLPCINGKKINDSEFNKMHNWESSEIQKMKTWINLFEKNDVYFSSPLDIDFSMLKCFKNEYISTLEKREGPKLKNSIPIKELKINETEEEAYQLRINSDIRLTLKSEGGDGSTYTKEEKELMIWYAYFFLSRGKPTTHLSLFSVKSDLNFESFPKCLKNFVNRIIEKMGE